MAKDSTARSTVEREWSRKWLYVGWAVLALAFLLVAFGRNRFTRSDPRGTLLVSEAILVDHTIRLDDYPPNRLEGEYQFQFRNGHYYYYYPLGSSIASLPFVALARGFGFNIRESEPELQVVIAAVVAVLNLSLLIKLAGLFLAPGNAILAAGVFWFGTSLVSTGATALWSHDFAVLFALVAIYTSVYSALNDRPQTWPITAVSLFAAYLCRPTLALLAPAVLVFLFSYSKGPAIKAAALLLLGLVGFVAFNLREFGQVLPDYYMGGWMTGGHFLAALYANVLSPSRGLFIFSPFLPLALAHLAISRKTLPLKRTWLFIGAGWPLLHLLLVSQNSIWWGGYSFGPRMTMDALPGLFLLTIYAWPTRINGAASKVLISALALASAVAIFVNTGQGLFNRWTATWNSTPSIDIYPEYVFDWQYPQFLAGETGQAARLMRHAITHDVSTDSAQ